MSKNSSVSRRSVLGGLAAVAAVPLLESGAIAAPVVRSRRGIGPLAPSTGRVRFQHAIVELADGRLLVSGGYHHLQASGTNMPSSSVQIYDPATGTWVNAAPLNTARAQHAAVRMADGRIAVLGGFSHTALSSVEIYDPGSNTWTAGPSLSQPIYGHTAAPTGNLIAISGGQNGIPLQLFDPKPSARIQY